MPGMNFKSPPLLVASDIGGTLIGKDNRIGAYTVSVFEKLLDQGVPVVLITGYNYHTTLRITHNLDERVVRMPQNGTLCIENGKPIWEEKIDREMVIRIAAFLEARRLPVVVYQGRSGQYRNLVIPLGEQAISGDFTPILTLPDFSSITGISTRLDERLVPEIRSKLTELIDGRYTLIYVREKEASWLEVTPPTVRKDLALKRFCSQKNIPLDRVLFFGDNFNDLEALEAVGEPVVVENAVEELKARFSLRADFVDREGVAHYLARRFFLN
jgi:HAD superfamily hydrolase (TIGR01484 family)